MRGQRRQVIGIVIHVVAAAHLSGPAMASAVMSYDAIVVLEEEQHLRVPVIGRQRPAMAEYDRLTFPPVLVEDLNAVFCHDHGHGRTPLWDDGDVSPPVIPGRRAASNPESG